MPDDTVTEVPVWTLASREVEFPVLGDFSSMTPTRLSELRTVLAALADVPIATMEAYASPREFDSNQGLLLSSASPLAQVLSDFASQLPTQMSQSGGGTLYRIVLPAKVAAQVGNEALRPMTAKGGGVYSALVNSDNRIAAQSKFVPVPDNANGTASNFAKVALAAPLIVSAVAACASIHAEHQRQQAIERISELLEKLHQVQLDNERNQLDGCRSPIAKATAILLDRGLIGEALGLGPAVYAIETAVAAAKRRVTRWSESLDGLSDGPVELAKIKRLFPGINSPNGEFHAKVDLARAAIAMKRRAIVLQAVEQAQLNPDNIFERFSQVLRQDQSDIDELATELDSLLLRLSRLHLDRSHGVRDFAFSSAQVDELLHASRRFRTFGDAVINRPAGTADVAIEIVRKEDGSVIVFPAVTAAPQSA